MPIRSTSSPRAADRATRASRGEPAQTPNVTDASPAPQTPDVNPDIAGRPSAVFTGADERPEFRISVRPAPGQTNAPTPALLLDWKDATVNARAKQLARADLLSDPKVRQQIDAEVRALARQEGRPLTEKEEKKVTGAVLKPLLPAFYAKHYQQLAASDATKQQALADTIAEYRPKMARYKDPFTPVAQGDPAARAKETMLWEDQDVMVMVDTFCPSPKALVVPKDTYNFPTDVPGALMDRIADIAAKVSDAFSKASGSNPADIWINPPQRITISQMHVHVQPKLPHWEPHRRPRGVPPDPALVAEQQKFYRAVTSELSKLLGPSS